MTKRSGHAPAIVLGAASALSAACSSSASPGNTTPARADAAADASSPASAADASNESVSSPDGAPTDSPSSDVPSGDGPTIDGGPLGLSSCDPAHVWGMPQFRIPFTTTPANFGRFGGISIDELTIAWTSTTGEISVADRATRHATFTAVSTIATSATPVALDRVALSPTGMVVIAVSADRKGFVPFNRTAVGGTFGASATLPFVNLVAMLTAEVQGQFSEPVLGADENTLFYVFESSGVAPALYESRWDGQRGAWTTGVALPNAELASAGPAMETYATGGSADGRTLFFHDGTTGLERAAWRDSPASPFVQFVDVPGMSEATPNLRCDTLYFQGTDSAGSGAFIAQ
jgi:hypothetical protein